MTADVGKKLLAEVEETSLDEWKLLRDLHLQQDATVRPFKFPPLDRILQAAAEVWPTNRTNTFQPVVEMMSLAAGDGKTQLIYHLSASAVLPYHLGGRQAAVVIVDTDARFSVDRAAMHIQTLLEDSSRSEPDPEGYAMIHDETTSALKHIHIFRPQSLTATTVTLDSIPDYLFNRDRHHSFDRELAFIAIDSASAFYWQDQAQIENAKFQAATGERIIETPNTISGYQPMFASLKRATQALNCPAIVTSWHLQRIYADNRTPRVYRQGLPDFRPTIRLVMRKVPVRKFPPGLTVEQALRESSDRQKGVDEGKFECFVNHNGLDERCLKTFAGDQEGFSFLVGERGVVMDIVEEDEPEQNEL